MSPWLLLAGLVASALASLLFSTLTYALRDLSRPRLTEYLQRRNRADMADRVARRVVARSEERARFAEQRMRARSRGSRGGG